MGRGTNPKLEPNEEAVWLGNVPCHELYPGQRGGAAGLILSSLILLSIACCYSAVLELQVPAVAAIAGENVADNMLE